MVFPAGEYAALPLYPGKETLDEPASHIAAQPSSILCRRLDAIGAVWRNHLDTISSQLLVERIAVIGTVADQVFRHPMAYLDVHARCRYRPRDIAEVEEKVSFINAPLTAPDGTAALPVCYREGHCARCCARASSFMPKSCWHDWRLDQRQVVRELYAQTRRQVQALAAVLELEGLQ